MNVLLIGAASELANQLIKKMNKEGHRVSLLTGSRYGQEKYERVFERYDFQYTNVSMIEIFESAAPDAVIYLGAYDRTYNWVNAQEDSVRFISGLMSILMAYASYGRGRFLFLSSEAVFSWTGEKKETDKPDDTELKGMAVAQGEALCDSFRISRDMDILTVRLGGLYGVARELSYVDSFPAAMSLEALQTGHVSARADCKRSLLHVADAVQFLGQILAAPEHKYNLYHITGQTVEEEEVARYVAAAFVEQRKERGETPNEEIKVDVTKGKGTLHMSLDCTRFREEFGINRLNDVNESVQKIVRRMVRHKELFLTDREVALPWYKRLWMKAGWAFQALLPFLENMIAFIPFFILNNHAAGSQFFAKIDF